MKLFVAVITCAVFQTSICQHLQSLSSKDCNLCQAECQLKGNLTGTITLQMNGSVTMVSGTVTGKGWKLTPGNHGFHIHEKSDPVCTKTGGHYNPKSQTHGDVNTDVRHAGDMGNIFANDNGEANVNINVKENLDELINRYI